MSQTVKETGALISLMQSNNLIQRFLFDDTDIRGEVTTLDKAYQDALSHQSLPDGLARVFGEFLAAASLLSEVLKFEGILTLQARGDGDVAIIMAEASHKGDIRGIVRLNPELESTPDFADLSLLTLLGEGLLTITIDPEKGKRYQGIVPIEKDALAGCLQDYFKQSEQLPTQIQLFANTTHCGGLFLQCLPAQLISDATERQQIWETATQLANTVTEDELYSLECETLLLRLFSEFTCRVFPSKPIQFNCSCNRERSGGAIRSLGYEDAQALLRERDIVNIDCQFCGKTYSFGEKALIELFPKEGKPLH